MPPSATRHPKPAAHGVKRLAAVLALLVLAASPARADLWGRAEKDPNWVAGRAALEDGFYGLAQEKFRAYIDGAFFKRNKARGSLYLAQALVAEGKYRDAAAWLGEHREWADGTDVAGSFAYWLARTQYELGEFDAVTGTLYRFERLYPEDENLSRVFRLRTHALVKLGQRERALKSFSSFQERYPRAAEVPDNMLDWARMLIEDGRPQDAQSLLEKIVEQHGASTAAQDARLWLGRLLMDQQDYPRALALLDELARPAGAEPDVRAQAWMALARIADAQTNVAAAIDAYDQGERAAADTGLKLENRLNRARLLARAGSVEVAVNLLEGAVASAPTHPLGGEAQLELAGLQLEQGRPARALEAYQSYLEAYDEPDGQARALMGRAWSLWNLGRYAEAAAAFEKAFPEQRDAELRQTALIKAADAYFANAQYKLAEEAYRRELTEYPAGARTAQVLLQMGESQARLRDYEAAESSLERLRRDFAADPLAARAALRLASFREEQGQWEDAAQRYNDVLQTYTGSNVLAEALQRSALALYRGGDFQAAYDRFERVAREYPDSPWAEQAQYLRAWSLHMLGDTRRAVQMAQQFLERNPRSAWSPDVRFWLGEQQFNAGDYKEAEAAFLAVVKQYGSHELADDALYWAGRAASAQTDYRRAIAAFNDLTRSYTNSPLVAEARFAQGDALSEMGEFSGAILAFDDIVRKYPGSPLADRARGRKGDCQFTLGGERADRYQEAIASYRAVLDSASASPSLKLQAEFKIGRCYEKLGRRAEAFQYYMNVVYGWLGQRDRGAPVESVWFARAAFSAAGLKEAERAWPEAIRIYERVQEAGIPAGADAAKRIQKIRADRGAATGDQGPGKVLR